MKALLQRVREAQVVVRDQVSGVEARVGEIGPGITLFLAVEPADDESVVDRMLEKILAYRLFSDTAGKMNLSVRDICGGVLVVSQFTLAADTKKGLRPNFSSAASPELACRLYEDFVKKLQGRHKKVATGVFGADMNWIGQ